MEAIVGLPVLGGPKGARKHNLSIASIPVCLQVWLLDLASAARTHNHVTEGPPFYHPAMHVHYFTTATDKGGSSRGVDVGQEDMQQKSDVTQNLRANLRTQASL